MFFIRRVVFAFFKLLHFFEEFVGNIVGYTGPNINNFVIAFAFRDDTGFGLGLNLFNLFLGLSNVFLLGRRNRHIRNGDGQAGQSGIVITHLHNLVQELYGFVAAVFFALVTFIYQGSQFFLADRFINIFPTFRHSLVENNAAHGSKIFPLGGIFFVFAFQAGFRNSVNTAHFDFGVVRKFTVFQSHQGIFFAAEDRTFADIAVFNLSQETYTQDHIVRRSGNRFTGRRGQNVVRGQHQGTGFHLGFQRKRYVHGHLVTVEVSVESGTGKRVQLDGFTFNKYRFKGLNTQTVQSRSAV